MVLPQGLSEATVIQGLTGLEGGFPRWLIHTAIGRKSQFLITWVSLQGYLRVLTVWQLAFPRLSDDPSQKTRQEAQ